MIVTNSTPVWKFRIQGEKADQSPQAGMLASFNGCSSPAHGKSTPWDSGANPKPRGYAGHPRNCKGCTAPLPSQKCLLLAKCSSRKPYLEQNTVNGDLVLGLENSWKSVLHLLESWLADHFYYLSLNEPPVWYLLPWWRQEKAAPLKAWHF